VGPRTRRRRERLDEAEERGGGERERVHGRCWRASGRWILNQRVIQGLRASPTHNTRLQLGHGMLLLLQVGLRLGRARSCSRVVELSRAMARVHGTRSSQANGEPMGH
jgi:hypothetical protein